MTNRQERITPGQGLLLLIKHYQDDPVKCRALKNLYLIGANNGERCIAICEALLDEPLMQNYEIAIDEASINADPTRRYFETHLAFETLKQQLKLVRSRELISLYLASIKLFYAEISPERLETVIEVVNGKLIRPIFKKNENYQYYFYIKRIFEGSIFAEFTISERNKILYLERVLYLALVNGWCKVEMPIDIYRGECFSPTYRGRVKREMSDLRLMRNQHFGLMKGYMPLAANDVARSDIPFEHIKSGDYSTFDVDSPSVQACFQQLVHPYSNSISGSFLVLLRVLGRLHAEQQALDFMTSLDKFLLLLRLCMSSALFYTGGHSLYEYMAILNLPEVQEFFQFLPGFAALDLATLFYDNNEAAFDEALDATLAYQAHLMNKKTLHDELTSKIACI
jgi:hypothetical protein